MGKYCAYCKYLIADKKKEGTYYCEKKSKYILACEDMEYSCGTYEESSRGVYTSDIIFNDSKTRYNHDSRNSSKYCCDCRFYDIEKGNSGNYYCTKKDKKFFANNPECYMFESTGRSNSENEKLYDEAKKNQENVSADGSSPGFGGLFLFLLIFIILAVLVNVFGILK